MFPRLGTVLLAHQIEQARRQGQRKATAESAAYPEELGMLLRLGAVVATGMVLVALVMWVSL